MRSAPFARRCWNSFTGGRPAPLPRTAERGREGYTLRRRVWASFTGTVLPPAHPRPSAGTVPSAAQATPYRLGPGPRSGRPGDRPVPRWFTLPPLLSVGGVTAAGGDAVVLETVSPDGATAFLVRRRGSGRSEYSLELVVRSADPEWQWPLVSTIKYSGADGAERVVLVPVARAGFGAAASYVHLPGFTGEASSTGWSARTPAPLADPDPHWDADTVAASVRAALNEATREAWRQVRAHVGDDLRRAIDGELT
ncbi:hypothetical protein [Streptomyces sp. NPDC090445]|uniref:hypothetical protein n=1 Tax=Streptomyces sp. NPDC090445 TaxID=3365963 RepID=UPI0038015AB2